MNSRADRVVERQGYSSIISQLLRSLRACIVNAKPALQVIRSGKRLHIYDEASWILSNPLQSFDP